MKRFIIPLIIALVTVLLTGLSWKYGYAKVTGRPEMVLQVGHAEFVYSFVFSKDGKYGLSASGDCTLKLWDISCGKEIRTFPGHTNHINISAFSPDGRYVMSGSHDGSMKVWNIETGKEISSFNGNSGVVIAVASSPDNKYALLAAGKIIKIWNIGTGKEIMTLDKHADKVNSAVFSPDGKYLLSGSSDGTMRLWEVSNGKEVRVFEANNQNVNSVAFSPDGKYALSGSWNDTMRLWEVSSGKEVRTFAGHLSRIKSVVFSPDGKYILSLADDNTVLWHVSTGKEMRIFSGNVFNLTTVAFSSDGKCALLGSFCDANVVTLDLATGREIRRFVAHADAIRSVTFSPDGSKLVTGSIYCGIKLWDIASAKELLLNTGIVNPIIFSPDRKYAITVSGYDIIKVWDLSSGKLIKTFPESYGRILSGAFSPDGRYILISPEKKPLRLLDIANGVEIRKFTMDSDSILSIAFSPDSKYAATVSDRKKIKFWDIVTGKEVNTFAGDSHDILQIVFSPDGKYILSCSSDRTLSLLDVATGKKIRTFTGHSGAPCAAAFSPDGKFIISCSYDVFGRIKDFNLILWDVATGKEIRTFAGHSSSLYAVAFSPDGKYILSGSADKTARLWNIKTGEWVAFMSHTNGKDWFIFDSDGNWDSSRHGGDLVAMVSGMNCWNIDQFAIRNNRPDLILAKLPNHENNLISEYYKQYRKRISKLEKFYGIKEADLSSEMHVPKAEIIKTERKNKNLTLFIKLTDLKYNIVSYNIYVNDVPVYSEIGKKINRNNKLEITETIELSAGENKIEVSCFNETGAESYRSLIFAYYEGNKKGNLYFIGFGVSDYKDESINDLKYSENDVLDLAGKFSSMNNDYVNINIKTYIGKEVTPANIKSAKDFIKNAGVDDTVVLFISGHGMHDSDEYRTYYYLTQNTDMTKLKETAADFETVEDILAGIKPRKKLFLMDTCDSGELDDFAGGKAVVYENKGDRGIPRTPKGIVVEYADRRGYFDKSRFIYNDLFRRTGAVVFSSSMGGEASWEFDVLKNGAFTEAILEGLSGKADIDKNGTVTVDELRDYVSKSVNDYTEGKQHPVIDRDNIYVKFELPVNTGK